MQFAVQIAVMNRKNKTVANTLREKVEATDAKEALTKALDQMYSDERLSSDDLYQAKVSII